MVESIYVEPQKSQKVCCKRRIYELQATCGYLRNSFRSLHIRSCKASPPPGHVHSSTSWHCFKSCKARTNKLPDFTSHKQKALEAVCESTKQRRSRPIGEDGHRFDFMYSVFEVRLDHGATAQDCSKVCKHGQAGRPTITWTSFCGDQSTCMLSSLRAA